MLCNTQLGVAVHFPESIPPPAKLPYSFEYEKSTKFRLAVYQGFYEEITDLYKLMIYGVIMGEDSDKRNMALWELRRREKAVFREILTRFLDHKHRLVNVITGDARIRKPNDNEKMYTLGMKSLTDLISIFMAYKHRNLPMGNNADLNIYTDTYNSHWDSNTWPDLVAPYCEPQDHRVAAVVCKSWNRAFDLNAGMKRSVPEPEKYGKRLGESLADISKGKYNRFMSYLQCSVPEELAAQKAQIMAGLWSVLAKKYQNVLMMSWNTSVLHYGTAVVPFAIYQACSLASSNRHIPEVVVRVEEVVDEKKEDRAWVESDAGKTFIYILENSKPHSDHSSDHYSELAMKLKQ